MVELKICDGFALQNVEVYKHGDLAGYIHAMLLDEKRDKWHETLFRIHETSNGEDYSLVSVDYGWEIGNDEIITMTEMKLIEYAKGLNIDFGELESNQVK